MRHKPAFIRRAGTPAHDETPARASTLAERIEEAKARMASPATLAESCYWQGALAALEAFSAGRPMPEVIGE